ncbi:MAG TPA: cytochrome c [Solirubrobacteraceae bacterium]|nr:cytochrome c [Solirubrobacteraceae bacterium]
MARSRRRLVTAAVTVTAALALGACGEEGIQLAQDDPNYEGAQIFNENCAGCHSLEAAGAHGSNTTVKTREIKDGPSFNERVETEEDVLYAIRNGGFSSGPMPQNIVTGEQAEKVAAFVAEYSGGGADRPATPSNSSR